MANDDRNPHNNPATTTEDTMMGDGASVKAVTNGSDSCPDYSPDTRPDYTPEPESSLRPTCELREPRPESLARDAEKTLTCVRVAVRHIYTLVYDIPREIHRGTWDPRPISDDKMAQRQKQFALEAAESVPKVLESLHSVLVALNVDTSLPETMRMVADTIVETYSLLANYSAEQDAYEKEVAAKKKAKPSATTAAEKEKENEDKAQFEDGLFLRAGWVSLDYYFIYRVMMQKSYDRLVERVRTRGQDTADTGNTPTKNNEKEQKFVAQATVLSRIDIRDAIISAMAALILTTGCFYTTNILSQWTKVQRELLSQYVQSCMGAGSEGVDTLNLAGTTVHSISMLYIEYSRDVLKWIMVEMKDMIELIELNESGELDSKGKGGETTTESGPLSKAPKQQKETRRALWWRLFKSRRTMKDANQM